MEEGHQFDGVYLDLGKAFDRLNHDLLVAETLPYQ